MTIFFSAGDFLALFGVAVFFFAWGVFTFGVAVFFFAGGVFAFGMVGVATVLFFPFVVFFTAEPPTLPPPLPRVGVIKRAAIGDVGLVDGPAVKTSGALLRKVWGVGKRRI